MKSAKESYEAVCREYENGNYKKSYLHLLDLCLTMDFSMDAGCYAEMAAVWKRTGNEELAGMLGEMSFVPGGLTADPATWHDWLKCVDQSINGEVDSMLRAQDGSIIDLHGALKEDES